MRADARAHLIAQHAPIAASVNIVMPAARAEYVHGQSHRRVLLHHPRTHRVRPPLIRRARPLSNSYTPANARPLQRKVPVANVPREPTAIAGSMGARKTLRKNSTHVEKLFAKNHRISYIWQILLELSMYQ